ncbi:MAG: hypothetical protein JO348_01070 [Alphaproteobacteria bacterium]|nr:hypothetical protein [Alphaproteobacteria bacterium]MBV9418339.1 hypothetical protein [Alphaproteobacteria bacterium]MBV9542211.1 hypothetical protein [Alphaproteobacteria bacterium]MBV9903387.1 hypothetical protein [Alphaproteobacteria bacterium]
MSRFNFQSDKRDDDDWRWYSGSGRSLRRIEPDASKADDNSPAAVFREIAIVLIIVLGVALAINLGLKAFGIS